MKRLGLDEDRKLTLLVVDDDTIARMAVRRALKKAELGLTLVEASDMDEALAALSTNSVDVAIVDYFLPGGNGLELVAQMREVTPMLPVVFLTGQGDEELAASIMRTRGAEYLSKAQLTPLQLVQSLRYAIGYVESERREKAAREALEASLDNAQRAARARDDVLAIVSHDLRNPLNVLSMSVSLLRETQAADGPAPLLDKMDRAVSRMHRLIEDLLDASRIEGASLAVDAQPVAATELVEAVVEGQVLAAQTKGIALHRAFDPDVGIVSADRHRVTQVLTNLVDNALKFTPQGGRVEVLAERAGDPEKVLFTVRDSGAGIAEADLPHVFDRYWKERKPSRDGAGLGLYIADGIVRAHGSAMRVRSTLGVGTEFSFELKRQEATP